MVLVGYKRQGAGLCIAVVASALGYGGAYYLRTDRCLALARQARRPARNFRAGLYFP
jgi:hypothetical protein